MRSGDPFFLETRRRAERAEEPGDLRGTGTQSALASATEAEGDAVTEAEAGAQMELHRIVEELDSIRTRLVDLHAKLPVSPEETAMLVGEVEMDFATEVRSVIECVLNDNIQPAIRDLAAAASCQPKNRLPEPSEDATPMNGIRVEKQDRSKSGR
jgi:hypothetical protein